MKRMITLIKIVTENYNGLPSKLTFMLTHAYTCNPLFSY